MRRNKKPKTHKEKIFIDPSPSSFELAFQMRLGQTPLEWVKMKVEGGSQLESIQYLFEISAAEIARQNNCVPQPFDTSAIAVAEKLGKKILQIDPQCIQLH